MLHLCSRSHKEILCIQFVLHPSAPCLSARRSWGRLRGQCCCWTAVPPPPRAPISPGSAADSRVGCGALLWKVGTGRQAARRSGRGRRLARGRRCSSPAPPCARGGERRHPPATRANPKEPAPGEASSSVKTETITAGIRRILYARAEVCSFVGRWMLDSRVWLESSPFIGLELVTCRTRDKQFLDAHCISNIPCPKTQQP